MPLVVIWLNEARHECAAPADAAPLLSVLGALGIPYRLRTGTWRDPALAAEPLLERAGALDGALEIVHNGRLATVGIVHLRVRAGDEVVIGQSNYLRHRFAFFR